MNSETLTASARHLQDRDSNVHAVPLHLLLLEQREQLEQATAAESTAEIQLERTDFSGIVSEGTYQLTLQRQTCSCCTWQDMQLFCLTSIINTLLCELSN